MSKTQTYLAMVFIFVSGILTLQYGIVRYGFAPYGMHTSAFGFDNIIAYRSSGRFVKTAKISNTDEGYAVYMIGSSRVRDGLAPQTVLDMTGLSTFNYGVSGLQAKEMAQMVDHLLRTKNPQKIIIGLDFFAFHDGAPSIDNMALRRSLSVEDRIKLYLSIFSLKSIKEAWHYKHKGIAIVCGRDGFCHDTRFTPAQVAHYIKQGLTNMGSKGHVLEGFNSYAQSLSAFTTMLEKLSDTEVEVLFFHAPAHHAYYDRLQEIGLFQSHKRWKADINKVIVNQGYMLWDFNIKSPATTLAFAESARYFNDDLHYTKHFGDIILKTVLNGDEANQYKAYSSRMR